MKVVGRKLLDDFARRHADVRTQINAWLVEVEEAEWSTPKDIKARYVHASILAGNLVVFNLKGNDYRLAAKIAYKNRVVFIEKIGTHKEYKTWDL